MDETEFRDKTKRFLDSLTKLADEQEIEDEVFMATLMAAISMHVANSGLDSFKFERVLSNCIGIAKLSKHEKKDCCE